MRNIVIIVTTFLLLVSYNDIYTQTGNYDQIFNRDYDNAVEFIQTNNCIIKCTAVKYKLDEKVLLSIVFPELIRYSKIKDYIEITGLKVLYVNFGKTYSNFSIGPFQMKPSFVELLEKEILQSKNKKMFKDVTTYNTNIIQEIRSERISRLESFEWQLKYLACFIYVVKEKFGYMLINSDEDDKIRFISTAYNCGFYKKYDVIKEYQTKKYFNYNNKKYCYGDVALFFFKNKSIGI